MLPRERRSGTNPEELLGAAHAACSTMSFVRLLGMANFVPEQVEILIARTDQSQA